MSALDLAVCGWIGLSLSAAVIALLVVALCRMAALADRSMERITREQLDRR